MTRLLFLLVLLAVSLACADELGDEIAALKISLPAGKAVSSNELRQVLQLAHNAGMKRVAVIEPSGSQWGEPGLRVTAAEIVEGRRITRQELIVWNDDWRNRSSPDRSSVPRLGKFSHDQTRAYAREWATFTINGQATRLECQQDTDLTDADKVLAALAARRIEYSTASVRSKAEAMTFKSLRYISVRGGVVRVGFNHSDRWCGDSITAKLIEDKLIIEDAMTICA